MSPPDDHPLLPNDVFDEVFPVYSFTLELQEAWSSEASASQARLQVWNFDKHVMPEWTKREYKAAVTSDIFYDHVKARLMIEGSTAPSRDDLEWKRVRSHKGDRTSGVSATCGQTLQRHHHSTSHSTSGAMKNNHDETYQAGLVHCEGLSSARLTIESELSRNSIAAFHLVGRAQSEGRNTVGRGETVAPMRQTKHAASLAKSRAARHATWKDESDDDFERKPQTSNIISRKAKSGKKREISSDDSAGERGPPTKKARGCENGGPQSDEAESTAIRSVAADFHVVNCQSWDDFDQQFEAYAEANFVNFRKRSSTSTASWNRSHPNRQVPTHFGVFQRNYWCTHGCKNESRGTGQRVHKHVNYVGCPARMIVELVQRMTPAGELEWFIEVKSQNTVHNQITSSNALVKPKAASVDFIQLTSRIQGRQRTDGTTNKKARRIRVVLPKWVGLADFVFWLSRHPVSSDIDRATERYPVESIRARVPAVRFLRIDPADHMHPGLVTKERAELMSGALEGARRGRSDKLYDFTEGSAGCYAVSFEKFAPGSTLYTEEYIRAAIDYYRLKTHRWIRDADLVWLEQTATAEPSDIVDQIFRTQHFSNKPVPISHIISAVITAFKRMPAVGAFAVTQTSNPSQAFEVSFQMVVGKMAGTAWISDAILQFALHSIGAGRSDYVVLDCLWERDINFQVPTMPITDIRFVVSPRRLHGNHWVVSIVEFDWTRNAITHWMYDPMVLKTNLREMGETFNDKLLPFLEQWLQRDQTPSHQLDESGCYTMARRKFHSVRLEIITKPQQGEKDFVNCGFLCILGVSSLINSIVISYPEVPKDPTDPEGPKHDHLNANDLLCLRLRTMYAVLCDSTTVLPSDDDHMRIHQIDKTIQTLIR